ncbi:hypothetical protein [Rathayibacter tanaceti]|nr:hypothetical protein [Rathayibacter tanaceti]
MSRFLARFDKGRPRPSLHQIEKSLMQLLEPAAQRSATDLFVLTQGLPAQASSKSEFYEVTFVQFLYQYLMMSPAFREYRVGWEVPYASGAGNPKRVDVVLTPRGGGAPILIEAGRFSVQKMKDDSAKLRDLRSGVKRVPGVKRVLLYWIGNDAPKNAGKTRETVRKPMTNRASRRAVGAAHVRPLWVMGIDLHAHAGEESTQFTAVLIEVLP